MQLEQPPPYTHTAECRNPGPVFERGLAFLTATIGETQYSSFPLQFLICLKPLGYVSNLNPDTM